MNSHLKQRMSATLVQVSQENIASDIPNSAILLSGNTINPWGVVSYQGYTYVANNGSGTISVFRCDTLVNEIKVNDTLGNPASPTGIIVNEATSGYIITSGTLNAPATLLISTEQGFIFGWAASVSPDAILVQDDSGLGVIYKGLAMVQTMLYLCDFGNSLIREYDPTWTMVRTFTDTGLQAVGYAPFNCIPKPICSCPGLLVSFALKENLTDIDETAGPGNGYLDTFDVMGMLQARIHSRGPLNAPWGMTYIFVEGRIQVLVGNFGDGTIHVFDLEARQYVGHVQDAYGNNLQIDGLWGLENIDNKKVLFAAGSQDEQHGLYGKLTLDRIARACDLYRPRIAEQEEEESCHKRKEHCESYSRRHHSSSSRSPSHRHHETSYSTHFMSSS